MKISMYWLLIPLLFLSACNDTLVKDKKSTRSHSNRQGTRSYDAPIASTYKLIDMNMSGGLDSYDYVDKHPHIKQGKELVLKYTKSQTLIDLNNITKVVSDHKGGYFLTGSNVRSSSIRDSDLVEKNFKDFLYNKNPTAGSIRAKVKHYDANLTLTTESNWLSSYIYMPVALSYYKKKLVVALRPHTVGKNMLLASAVVVFDENLKELFRREYKNIIINTMQIAKNGDILCSGVEKQLVKEGRELKYKRILLVLDSDGFIKTKLLFGGTVYNEFTFSVATLLNSFKEGYIVSGFEYTSYITSKYTLDTSIVVYPYLTSKYSYYAKGTFVSKDNKIAMFGHFGYESNPRALENMPDPYDRTAYNGEIQGLIGTFSSASKGALQQAYMVMYDEMKSMNQAFSVPFKNLILSQDIEINTVDMDNENPTYLGAYEEGGYLYIESVYRGYKNDGNYFIESKNSLYDNALSLRFDTKEGIQRCKISCNIAKDSLIWFEMKKDALYMHQEKFIKHQ